MKTKYHNLKRYKNCKRCTMTEEYFRIYGHCHSSGKIVEWDDMGAREKVICPFRNGR